MAKGRSVGQELAHPVRARFGGQTAGAEVRWPALYAKARDDGDRSVRTEAFEAMATGRWDLVAAVWRETDLLLWKPPEAWFSVNAFYDWAWCFTDEVFLVRSGHGGSGQVRRQPR
ncbi:hypothetical protein [Streptomyces erythrochromogenes]|uniref:hypothetical protein n=1 Tax=Streptomyces erythrochromogenes TaxID=285574 RepID=UPI00381D0950